MPYTGHYRIEAIGAAGGCDDHWPPHSPQCKSGGTRMIGEFRLKMKEVIQVLVGQRGGRKKGAWSPGGGGGTFVVRGDSTPLIIAGGGGGVPRDENRHEKCNANTDTTGNAGYTSWPGGSNGTGASEIAIEYSGKGKVWLPISLIEKAL